MLPIELIREHVCPFLLSVELGTQVGCTLASIGATWRAYRSLWINDISTQEGAITHTQDMISAHGGMNRLDLQTYIKVALNATVLHSMK